MAFSDNSTTLTLAASFSLTYTSTPKVAISSELTKLAIYGKGASGANMNLYFIDYAGSTYETLEFPAETVLDPLNVYIALEETWLYVRQLASTLQTNLGGNQ
jgi:hypothetical protein